MCWGGGGNSTFQDLCGCWVLGHFQEPHVKEVGDFRVQIVEGRSQGSYVGERRWKYSEAKCKGD